MVSATALLLFLPSSSSIVLTMLSGLVPGTSYMPRHPQFDYSNYTWRKAQITKLLIMQLSPLSCHLISLLSKYPPQHRSLHPQSM
jgi:hypothetical protein